MTTTDIQQAKEWAESRASGNYLLSEGTEEAVKVIQSLPDTLPDTIVDGDKLREVINKVLANTVHGTVGHQVAEDYAALIGELIPAPSLPTLADMTPEEREACLWMQVDLPRHLPGAVLVDPGGHGSDPRVVYQDGAMFTVKHEEVTPLPGPKLEWPGSHADTITAESVEDTPAVDDEPVMMPRPKDVPAGKAWLVKCDGYEWVGTRYPRVETVCSWALVRLDGADFTVARDDEITLISRMVPEAKP